MAPWAPSFLPPWDSELCCLFPSACRRTDSPGADPAPRGCLPGFMVPEDSLACFLAQGPACEFGPSPTPRRSRCALPPVVGNASKVLPQVPCQARCMWHLRAGWILLDKSPRERTPSPWDKGQPLASGLRKVLPGHPISNLLEGCWQFSLPALLFFITVHTPCLACSFSLGGCS